MKKVLEFEIGKYYSHPGGGCMHILKEIDTTLFGKCFVAETHDSPYLKSIGMGKAGYSENWYLTDEEFWKTGFTK